VPDGIFCSSRFGFATIKSFKQDFYSFSSSANFMKFAKFIGYLFVTLILALITQKMRDFLLNLTTNLIATALSILIFLILLMLLFPEYRKILLGALK